jgi:predicted lipoprotein with Yx(FWY)xxD motif
MQRPQTVIRMAAAGVVALALLASACGKSDDNGSGGTTGSGATTAGTTTGGTTTPATTGGATTGGTTTGTTTGGGAGGKATVSAKEVGGLGTVLVDSRGFTLYHLDGETDSKFQCEGGCLDAWPPLVAKGAPTAGEGADGELATIDRPGVGKQVTYDGLPLYTFAGDSKPGEANGQGVSDVWFAVTPSGENAGGGAPSRGYGY